MLTAFLSCSAVPRAPDEAPAQVDRFEGDQAVLVQGRSQRTVPRHTLPPSVREGDTVPAAATAEALRRAQAQTEALRARVQAAREQAGGGTGGFNLDAPAPRLTLSGQR